MTFLSNIGIKVKILAAVLLMACVAVGGALYATSIMKNIGGSYDTLLNHEEMGVLQTSRFAQFVSGHGYAVYRLMESKNSVTATESDNYSNIQDRAKLEYAKLKAAATETLAMASQSLPDLAEDWNRKASAYQVIRNNTDRAMELVLADDITDATIVMAETDTLIAALTRSSTETVAALSDRIQKRSAALGADTQMTEYTTLGIMIGAAVLVGAVTMALAGRTITSPLGKLQDVMLRLAARDLDAVVPGQGRRDEVGRMAEAVQVFKLNAVRTRDLEVEATAARQSAEMERARSETVRADAARQQAEVVEGLAEGLDRLSRGDLVSRLDRAFSPEYEKLRRDFNDALTKLQQTLSVVAQNGSAIRSGTGEISNAADDLARRTERQATSLREAASALDAVTLTVRRTAQSAHHAKVAVLATKASAEDSGQVVRQAVLAMNDIESSSAQITQIIGVIDGIAFQTNLLALNAGVEAARAGDAGRGFAVVASEVRALAQRSAEAAKEIKALIAAARGQVERGVDLVGRTGAALDGMVTQVGDIATEVAAIAASAQDQATGLDQVNAAINQMDQVTQQNAAMMEESTAASQALSAETDAFLRVIGQFQVGTPQITGRGTRSASDPALRPPSRVLTVAHSRH